MTKLVVLSRSLFLLLPLFVSSCVSPTRPDGHAETYDLERRIAEEKELRGLESAAASTLFPTTLGDVYRRLGGRENFQWCCTIYGGPEGARRTILLFSIETMHLKGKGYVLEITGEEVNNDMSVISAARVGFRTPLGRIYYADSEQVKAMRPAEAVRIVPE